MGEFEKPSTMVKAYIARTEGEHPFRDAALRRGRNTARFALDHLPDPGSMDREAHPLVSRICTATSRGLGRLAGPEEPEVIDDAAMADVIPLRTGLRAREVHRLGLTD
jgi:hypothetical protein